MLLALWLMLAWPTRPVPVDLRPSAALAALAWFPLRPPVEAIVYRSLPPEDGGALYDADDATVYLDPSWPDFWGPDGPEALLITLEHEFGHALGLEHSSNPASIMHPGWERPWARRPTASDFEAAGLHLD